MTWQPGRWWRVVDANGKLWALTSSETEAREAMRPGDELQRRWVNEETEWRAAEEPNGWYGPACGCTKNVTPKMGGESECLRHGIQPTVFIAAEQGVSS